MKIFCKADLPLPGTFLIKKFTSGLQVPLYFMKYNISCKQGAVCFCFQKYTARFWKTKQKRVAPTHRRNYEENSGSKADNLEEK
jgi:hypothetical protein